MKYLKTIFTQRFALAALLLFGIQVAVVVPAFAAPQDEASSKALCEGSGGTWDSAKKSCGKTGTNSFPQALAQITNLLLFVIGSIAVIMIIVGAIRYVTSSGDQTALTAAKNTILYAVVGLVVAFMAYAIVNFVTAALK